jgi:hypothetical protein
MSNLLIGKPIILKYTTSLLKEGMDKNTGNLLLKSVPIITAEKENGNGRYYPKDLWEREITKFSKKIKEATTEACGELDHPDSEIINLSNISHCFRDVWWEGDIVRANIEVFCSEGVKGTPSGRILGSFLHNGLAVGFSTRGTGTLKQVGDIMEVQDDFNYVTTDAVSNPSNYGSWSRLNESKQTRTQSNLDKIIKEILCSKGNCPVF